MTRLPPRRLWIYVGRRLRLGASRQAPGDGRPRPEIPARVRRYRQPQPNGTVVEASWLTDFPVPRVGSPTLYRLAKSRWEGENQGFNEGEASHGLEPSCHHHANSLLIGWLLALFALTIERLSRLRSLRRGTHRPPPAIEFVRLLRLSLGPPRPPDTS